MNITILQTTFDVLSLIVGAGAILILIGITKIFHKKNKTQEGVKQLKGKLEYASKELIEAVEHLKNTQKVHNEFYEIIMAILNK